MGIKPVSYTHLDVYKRQAQCYQDFRTQLAPILKRIHGRVQHAGHVPPNVGRARQAREEMERLKAEMNEAVSTENFERAAQLRDRIRALAAQENAAVSQTASEQGTPAKEAADDAK